MESRVNDDPQVVQKSSYENPDTYVANEVLEYPGNVNSTPKTNGKLHGTLGTTRTKTQPPLGFFTGSVVSPYFVLAPHAR